MKCSRSGDVHRKYSCDNGGVEYKLEKECVEGCFDKGTEAFCNEDCPEETTRSCGNGYYPFETTERCGIVMSEREMRDNEICDDGVTKRYSCRNGVERVVEWNCHLGCDSEGDGCCWEGDEGVVQVSECSDDSTLVNQTVRDCLGNTYDPIEHVCGGGEKCFDNGQFSEQPGCYECGADYCTTNYGYVYRCSPNQNSVTLEC